jgi:hypothetical protein
MVKNSILQMKKQLLQELKKQRTSGTTVAIDNTQTNVSTMGNQNPNQVLSSARRPDLPLHQQG